jgi:Fe-S cluster assembly protein SufD
MKNDINKTAVERFIAIADKVIAETKNPVLAEIKTSAKKNLFAVSFPTLKTEEWKYTSLTKLLNTEFIPLPDIANKKITKEDIKNLKFNSFDSYLVVVVNGVLNKELSEIGNFEIATIDDAVLSGSSAAKNYFNKLSLTNTGFDYVNTSAFVGGVFIRIPDGMILEKPIQLLNVSVGEEENIFFAPRTLVVAGKNSQTVILQNYVSNTKSTVFNNNVAEIVLEENAVVDYYKIEIENKSTYHFDKVDVLQKRNSKFSHYNFTFGGKLVRNDVNTKLAAENVETVLNGLYIGNDNMHVDNNTFIEHAKPHCLSNQLYKGIMNDVSHGIFSGKILVAKDAQLTNAFQNNNSILLSDTAKADSKPQLEIYADDVKCTHGATVGHLDETAMFYILSRGIPKDKALQMLITAFAEDVVSGIKIDGLREDINKMIFEYLK